MQKFIQMKRKQEIYKATIQKRASTDAASDFRPAGLSQKGPLSMQKLSKQTQAICKDLTKWLHDNREHFVEDFQPSHVKYRTTIAKLQRRQGPAFVSRSVKSIYEAGRVPSNIQEKNNVSKIYGLNQDLNGRPSEIHG